MQLSTQYFLRMGLKECDNVHAKPTKPKHISKRTKFLVWF